MFDWSDNSQPNHQRDDPKIRQQVALLAEVFKAAFMEVGFDFIVRHFPEWTGFDVKIRHAELLKRMMTEEIESHRTNLVPGEPKASQQRTLPRKGKYHCTKADFLFGWFGFEQTSKIGVDST